MTRDPMPSRRQTITSNATWNGQHFAISVGLRPGTFQPGDVFADNAKGDMAHIIADACVWASLAMQNGTSPADLAKSLGRLPRIAEPGDMPASPLGVIAEAVVRADRRAHVGRIVSTWPAKDAS